MDQRDDLSTELATLIRSLEERAGKQNSALTCDDLVAQLGPQSHALALLIFALLNLLPGPPGYSVLLGLITMAFALLLIMGRPIHLWPIVGHRRLKLKLMIKLLAILQRLMDWVGRVSAPRLFLLVSPTVTPIIGLFGVVMGLAMLAPIPFTNTLPAIAVALVSVGMLNRDGALVLVGFGTGLVGLIVLAAGVWLAITLVLLVEDRIDGE